MDSIGRTPIRTALPFLPSPVIATGSRMPRFIVAHRLCQKFVTCRVRIFAVIRPSVCAGDIDKPARPQHILRRNAGADINDLARDVEFDFLDISGSASLAGVVEVPLFDGYMPTPGATFMFLEAAGGISGLFDGSPAVIAATSRSNSSTARIAWF